MLCSQAGAAWLKVILFTHFLRRVFVETWQHSWTRPNYESTRFTITSLNTYATTFIKQKYGVIKSSSLQIWTSSLRVLTSKNASQHFQITGLCSFLWTRYKSITAKILSQHKILTDIELSQIFVGYQTCLRGRQRQRVERKKSTVGFVWQQYKTTHPCKSSIPSLFLLSLTNWSSETRARTLRGTQRHTASLVPSWLR